MLYLSARFAAAETSSSLALSFNAIRLQSDGPRPPAPVSSTAAAAPRPAAGPATTTQEPQPRWAPRVDVAPASSSPCLLAYWLAALAAR